MMDEESTPSDRDFERDCELDLAVACVFRDEAPYLKEWIEYHRMLGVQRFLLVDDRSADDFQAVLQPYVDRGIVMLFSRPCPEPLQGERWIDYQLAVVTALCRAARGMSRWLALVDVDEFIYLRDGASLPQFLGDYEEYGGLYVRWEPFGTSYLPRLDPARPMIAQLNRKWKFRRGHDILGKSILKPHRVRSPNIHRSELIRDYAYKDFNPDMEDENPPIKLHHYWSREVAYLFNVKIPRCAGIKGWVVDDAMIEYFTHLFNEVPDYAMLRFTPELARRLADEP